VLGAAPAAAVLAAGVPPAAAASHGALVELEDSELRVERRGLLSLGHREGGNSPRLRWRHRLLLSHLEGVEFVLVTHEFVAVVDLMKQEGVVDAQHLVLEERRVHLSVLFFALRGFGALVLVPVLSFALWLLRRWLSEDLNLGPKLHGDILVEAPLADESVPFGPEIGSLLH